MDCDLQNYYFGTSGLLLPVPNKTYYPAQFQAKSRLCYYGSLMNSIEINSSFYKIPLAITVKKWAVDVPQDFRFTFKLFKEITHHKNLAFDPSVVSKFFEAIAGAEPKSGCILVQLPPSVRIANYKQLQFLFNVLDEYNHLKWKIAVEFRHSSLYIDEVYELMEAHGFAMVIHDKFSNPTLQHQTHTNFIYLRFHGPEGNYRGTYTDDILYEYATYINDWAAEGKKVFVYFNNTMGDAIANLNALKQSVNSING